jgi:hypothetical protein
MKHLDVKSLNGRIAHDKRTFTDAGSHFEIAINFQGLARRPMRQMKETKKYFWSQTLCHWSPNLAYRVQFGLHVGCT